MQDAHSESRLADDTGFLPPMIDARHEAPFDRYARILVERAVDLQHGQRLEIWCDRVQRPFAFRVGEMAYSAGAGEVRYNFADLLEKAQLIRRGRADQISLYHVGVQKWLADVLRSRSALLVLQAASDRRLQDDLRRAHPRSHQLFYREEVAIGSDFLRRAVDQRLSPVVLAASPTPSWARQVLPDLPDDEAFHQLAELIFRFTFADRDDGIARAEAHARRLTRRCAVLDELGIREIRVTGGGNDMRLGLSEKSRWRDTGRATSAGQRFQLNVPSFEVFTTPDWRRTEGRLAAGRTFWLPGGAPVEGLVLTFREGRVVDVEARTGAQDFDRWLDVDEGARRLGEFALVGEDSPIARSGIHFGHTLLDENAAAHVGLGLGIASALDGGASLSPEELDALGFNTSAVHFDVPFGSAEVDVVATECRQGEVVLLERGRWTDPFVGDSKRAIVR